METRWPTHQVTIVSSDSMKPSPLRKFLPSAAAKARATLGFSAIYTVFVAHTSFRVYVDDILS